MTTLAWISAVTSVASMVLSAIAVWSVRQLRKVERKTDRIIHDVEE